MFILYYKYNAIIGIIWYFCNPKSIIPKIVITLGVIFIVATIIMSIRIYFVTTSIYSYIDVVKKNLIKNNAPMVIKRSLIYVLSNKLSRCDAGVIFDKAEMIQGFI